LVRIFFYSTDLLVAHFSKKGLQVTLKGGSLEQLVHPALEPKVLILDKHNKGEGEQFVLHLSIQQVKLDKTLEDKHNSLLVLEIDLLEVKQLIQFISQELLLSLLANIGNAVKALSS
jgi:hypothetical protein